MSPFIHHQKKMMGLEKKGRFAFGFESPFFNFTKSTAIFGGIGATLGDAKGLYLDAGFDWRVFEYFKLQAGMNYNSDGDAVPQLSAGLTWYLTTIK